MVCRSNCCSSMAKKRSASGRAPTTPMAAAITSRRRARTEPSATSVRSSSSLTDAIWAAAKRLNRREFVSEITPIEDDHLEFLAAGVPSVDLIDLEYPDATSRFWHTQYDTIENVGASSLQAVGDVLLAALPALETIDARTRR